MANYIVASDKITIITKITRNNNYNKNNKKSKNMSKKTCAVCGKPVYPGTGMHFSGRLIHKSCEGKAEAQWYRLGWRR
jgi:hypothetical protein